MTHYVVDVMLYLHKVIKNIVHYYVKYSEPLSMNLYFEIGRILIDLFK